MSGYSPQEGQTTQSNMYSSDGVHNDLVDDGWKWYSENGIIYRARKVKDFKELSTFEKIQLIGRDFFTLYSKLGMPEGAFLRMIFGDDPRYEIDKKSMHSDPCLLGNCDDLVVT